MKDQGFRVRLHSLLTNLTPAWPDGRTDALVDVIQHWNAEPSLTKQVALAAEHCRLPVPDALLVDPRNALLHDRKIKQKWGSLADYYKKVDETVLFLILRMLGYDGVVCSPVSRNGEVNLRELVANQGADSGV